MGARDWLIEKTVRVALNQTALAPYGEMTALRLNSSECTAEADVLLKGETVPITVRVLEYQILREDERVSVIVKEISTSREWLTNLARRFIVGKPFELPPAAAKFVPMLLG